MKTEMCFFWGLNVKLGIRLAGTRLAVRLGLGETSDLKEIKCRNKAGWV
jgi:hypothetical protein